MSMNIQRGGNTSLNFKGIISFIILTAFALVVGWVFTAGAADISIGLLLKLIVLSAPFLLLLILIQIFDPSSLGDLFSFRLAKPELGWTALLAILPLAVLSAFLMVFLANRGFGLTSLALLIFNLASYFFALYLFVKDRPIYGLSVFLLTIPFLASLETEFTLVLHPFLFFGDIYISPTLIYLLSLFLVSLITFKTDWSFFRREKTFLIAVLLFFIYPFISCLASPEPAKSLWITFLEIACPLFFFFILIRAIEGWRDVRVLLLSLVSYFPLYILIGFYLHSRYAEHFFGQQYLRDVSIGYYNLSSLTIGAMVILPLIYYFSLQERFKKLRPLFWLMFTFLVSVAFLLQNRTAIYSFFFCVILLASYSLIKARINWLLSLGVILIFVGAGTLFFYLISGFMFQRFYELVTKGELFFDVSRVSAWLGSLGMLKDHPLFGIGAGMWDKYVASYVSYRYAGGPGLRYYFIASPHNFYFNLAVFFGLPLIILYAFIIFRLFCKYGDIDRSKTASAGISPYLFMCLLLWLGAGITGCSFTYFASGYDPWYRLDFTLGFVFWTIVAAIICLHGFTARLPNER